MRDQDLRVRVPMESQYCHMWVGVLPRNKPRLEQLALMVGAI